MPKLSHFVIIAALGGALAGCGHSIAPAPNVPRPSPNTSTPAPGTSGNSSTTAAAILRCDENDDIGNPREFEACYFREILRRNLAPSLNLFQSLLTRISRAEGTNAVYTRQIRYALWTVRPEQITAEDAGLSQSELASLQVKLRANLDRLRDIFSQAARFATPEMLRRLRSGTVDIGVCLRFAAEMPEDSSNRWTLLGKILPLSPALALPYWRSHFSEASPPEWWRVYRAVPRLSRAECESLWEVLVDQPDLLPLFRLTRQNFARALSGLPGLRQVPERLPGLLFAIGIDENRRETERANLVRFLVELSRSEGRVLFARLRQSLYEEIRFAPGQHFFRNHFEDQYERIGEILPRAQREAVAAVRFNPERGLALISMLGAIEDAAIADPCGLVGESDRLETFFLYNLIWQDLGITAFTSIMRQLGR